MSKRYKIQDLFIKINLEYNVYISIYDKFMFTQSGNALYLEDRSEI